MSTQPTDDGADDSVRVEMEVRNGRTILTVDGKRDAAVIVRSGDDERIYLPPEDFDSAPTQTTAYSTTPYSTTTDSGEEETVPTPYNKTTDEADPDETDQLGRTTTPEGIRIVHPDTVTDVRFVR